MANSKDESFFARLQKLFKSGPSIRRKIKGYADTGYYDKRALVGNKHGNPGMLPMRKNSGQLDIMGGNATMSRTVRFQTYQEMEQTPIISKALDIIADESCSGDERGKNFHVFSDNPQIKEALEELFYDVLNVDFELRVWVRNLCKFGDAFLYNEVAPGVGVINAQLISVNEIEREEGFDPEDPYATRFKWTRFGQKYLDNWQVTHFRILGNEIFHPYGSSILEPARRIWQIYMMMIDAMFIYRLVRSPERRVFYVDVGTVASNDIQSYMNSVMSTIRGNMAIDKDTGRADERYNPVAVDEDYIIPVRGANSGTKVDTLAGGQNATATEDIELIQNQLFAALGVPKAYIGYDELLGAKSTLSQIDIRFSRTIQVIQKIIISELNKLAILHLYAKGFDGKDLIDFELRMSNPSSIAQQQKLDLWQTKINIIAAVDQIESRFLPFNFLYKEILGFSDDEIVRIKEDLKEDKRFSAELDSITEPEEKNQNTVDPFDPSRYGLPGGMPIKQSASIASPSLGNAKYALAQDTDGDSGSTNIRVKLDSDGLPIKDNPAVRQDQRNRSRRESEVEKASHTPDFKNIINPSKNRSFKDVYGQEFLNKSFREEIEKDLSLGVSKKPYIPKQLESILKNFDKAFKTKSGLTNNAKILIETDLLSEELNFQEEIAEDENELQEILLENISTRPSMPSLLELSQLGLDLKEDIEEVKSPYAPPSEPPPPENK